MKHKYSFSNAMTSKHNNSVILSNTFCNLSAINHSKSTNANEESLEGSFSILNNNEKTKLIQIPLFFYKEKEKTLKIDKNNNYIAKFIDKESLKPRTISIDKNKENNNLNQNIQKKTDFLINKIKNNVQKPKKITKILDINGSFENTINNYYVKKSNNTDPKLEIQMLKQFNNNLIKENLNLKNKVNSLEEKEVLMTIQLEKNQEEINKLTCELKALKIEKTGLSNIKINSFVIGHDSPNSLLNVKNKENFPFFANLNNRKMSKN